MTYIATMHIKLSKQDVKRLKTEAIDEIISRAGHEGMAPNFYPSVFLFEDEIAFSEIEGLWNKQIEEKIVSLLKEYHVTPLDVKFHSYESIYASLKLQQERESHLEETLGEFREKVRLLIRSSRAGRAAWERAEERYEILKELESRKQAEESDASTVSESQKQFPKGTKLPEEKMKQI